MRKLTIISTLIILIIFSSHNTKAQQVFNIDLNKSTDGLFHVVLYPEKLSKDNAIFQFAATAPGTYQSMDIGRFVHSFNAYDEQGNEIKVNHINTNQFEINEPEKVKTIKYTIEDTWHTKIDTEHVYPMSGSNIDSNEVLINGQCVFGYFHGMQAEPIKVKIDYPKDWLVGTALRKDDNGYFEAPTFDYIVDSPILLGKLTTSSIKIGNTNINLFTYSESGQVHSEDLLSSIKDILHATDKFLKGLPVPHYTFLFHFGKFSAGAWEHSYSSEYIYQDAPLTPAYIQRIKSVIAHEFFHIVTPLNIHSELVQQFNFVKPVMSQHLWFYEGVTEWAAHIIQLRDSLITLREYLDDVSKKLTVNDAYNPKISLTYLGKHSTELPDQYVNIYNKGAVTAALFDIRLLELSHGKKGLRELLLELLKKYGHDKAFSEDNFFNELVSMTYPQIADFIKDYIQGTEKLPVAEYFKKMGITYYENKGVDSSQGIIGVVFGFGGKNLVVREVNDNSINKGIIQPGDIIYGIEGTEITFTNFQSLFGKLRTMKAGDHIKFTVIRDDKKVDLDLTAQAKEIRHVFEIDPDPTTDQLALRKAWMENL